MTTPPTESQRAKALEHLKQFFELPDSIQESNTFGTTAHQFVDCLLEFSSQQAERIELPSREFLPARQIACWFETKDDIQVGYYVPHKESFAGCDADYHFTQVKAYYPLIQPQVTHPEQG